MGVWYRIFEFFLFIVGFFFVVIVKIRGFRVVLVYFGFSVFL